MRSCARVLRAVAIIGFVFVGLAPSTACSIAEDEDAHGPTGGGTNAGNPSGPNGAGPGSNTGTGGPSTGPGATKPGADGGVATNPGTDGGSTSPGTDGGSTPPRPQGGPGCSLQSAAFCDTFDQPAGIGNRSGDLSQSWGVSRTMGYIGNWATTPLDLCGTTVTADLKSDIKICNGHMVEAMNDDTSVAILAMYVKQPFDFAGRTGTMVFDVSNDSHGSHRAWPEIWFTDKPVPAPLIHQTSWNAVPKDGFGFELSGDCQPNSGCGACPTAQPYRQVGFGFGRIIRNYAHEDYGMAFADSRTTLHDCVKAASGPNEMNHFEVKVSQNTIEIYGTDAGTTAPLKKLVTLNNVNLTLTRGFMWIEDSHYNGNKDGPDQGLHTFAWDNVGFDGPVLPGDLAFDVLDDGSPGAPGSNGYPDVKLGWTVPAGTPKVLTVAGVTGIDAATAGIITLNFNADPGVTLTYSLNGNPAHVQPWVFPDTDASSWRTIALPIPLSEVVPGTNSISLAASGSSQVTFANVDLILLGAAGTH